MKQIGNASKALKIHKYYEYEIIKDGCKEMPWNIYQPFNTTSFFTKEEVTLRRWVGMGRSIAECKYQIENNLLEGDYVI